MCFTHFPPAAAAAAFIFRAHPDLPLASLCHSTNLPAECIHTCAVRYYCSTVAVRHPPSCCEQVSLDLRQLILELYERHLSPDGRSVSYKKLGSDPLFRRYVDATAELQKVWYLGGSGFRVWVFRRSINSTAELQKVWSSCDGRNGCPFSKALKPLTFSV